MPVVIGKICRVCLIIESLLTREHRTEIVDIGRIGHSLRVGRLRKFRQDQLTVTLGLGRAVAAHVHQVFIIIYVEAIHIVGVTAEQILPLGISGIEILKLILEYET